MTRRDDARDTYLVLAAVHGAHGGSTGADSDLAEGCGGAGEEGHGVERERETRGKAFSADQGVMVVPPLSVVLGVARIRSSPRPPSTPRPIPAQNVSHYQASEASACPQPIEPSANRTSSMSASWGSPDSDQATQLVAGAENFMFQWFQSNDSRYNAIREQCYTTTLKMLSVLVLGKNYSSGDPPVAV